MQLCASKTLVDDFWELLHELIALLCIAIETEFKQ